MTTIGIGVLWAAIAAVVALAVYRQVRAHIQLRKTLHDLGQTHDLLVAKLTAAAEALAQADAQEEPPSEERAPSGARTAAEAQALLYKALHMIRERLAEKHYLIGAEPYWLHADCGGTVFPRVVVNQGQCMRSSDDLIRVWQEEEDCRLLTRPAEAETV